MARKLNFKEISRGSHLEADDNTTYDSGACLYYFISFQSLFFRFDLNVNILIVGRSLGSQICTFYRVAPTAFYLYYVVCYISYLIVSYYESKSKRRLLITDPISATSLCTSSKSWTEFLLWRWDVCVCLCVLAKMPLGLLECTELCLLKH